MEFYDIFGLNHLDSIYIYSSPFIGFLCLFGFGLTVTSFHLLATQRVC